MTRVVLNHSQLVVGASLSPDDKHVLTCTEDGSAMVWEVSTARLESQMNAESQDKDSRGRSCAFSPDGSSILTVGYKLVPSVWDARDGRLIAALSGHTQPVLSGSFSSDGSMIVTAGQDKTARIWDAKTGRERLVYRDHDTAVSAAFFFPDNARVVSIGTEGKALVWEAATRSLNGYGARFSPDATLIATEQRGVARVYEASSGRLLQEWDTGWEGIESVAFSADSFWLAAGSTDGLVSVREARTGRALATMSPGDGRVRSMQFSADARTLVTFTDGSLRRYDLTDGSQLQRFQNNFGLHTASISPDGATAVAVDSLDRALIYSFDVQELLKQAPDRLPRVGDAPPSARQ